MCKEEYDQDTESEHEIEVRIDMNYLDSFGRKNQRRVEGAEGFCGIGNNGSGDGGGGGGDGGGGDGGGGDGAAG